MLAKLEKNIKKNISRITPQSSYSLYILAPRWTLTRVWKQSYLDFGVVNTVYQGK